MKKSRNKINCDKDRHYKKNLVKGRKYKFRTFKGVNGGVWGRYIRF